MREELKKQIDERLNGYKSKLPLNKDFFYDFFELLEESQYQGDMTKVMDIVFKDIDDIPNKASKEPLRFMLDYPVCKKRGQAFLRYVREKVKSVDDPQVLFDEMFNFIDRQSSDKTSFPNLLVKYVSLKYSEEIKLDVYNANMEDKNDDLIVYAKLGDFNIAALEAVYLDNVGLSVYEIRTLDNLTGQKIGSMLMQKFFQTLDSNFPEQEDLIIQNVVNSNVDAQRFYERLGGQFYTPEGQHIKREEITSDFPKKGHLNVLYDKDTIKTLSQEESVKPTSLQEYNSYQHKTRENDK